ncbi:small, acid-soluble spore protein, alpha/beta type [Tissierella sp.]|nr:small, acid-soluble spore protein, alpha/beta type [Tissierella sp.]
MEKGPLNSVEKIFAAGTVGGMMTKKLVEIGQKQLIGK